MMLSTTVLAILYTTSVALISAAFALKTENVLSSLIFKTLPFFLGLALIGIATGIIV